MEFQDLRVLYYPLVNLFFAF